MSGPRPAGTVVLEQPFQLDTLHLLRATMAALAGDLAVSQRELDDLLVVASELATNAVRYGGGHGRLWLWRDGGRVYCQVRDHGPGMPDAGMGRTRPDSTATAGRGLWICRQICSELIITVGGPEDPGTTVTAVMDVQDAPPPARNSHRHRTDVSRRTR